MVSAIEVILPMITNMFLDKFSSILLMVHLVESSEQKVIRSYGDFSKWQAIMSSMIYIPLVARAKSLLKFKILSVRNDG